MHKRNNEKREDEYVSICTERRWRSDRMTLPPSTPPMLRMKRPRSFTKKNRKVQEMSDKEIERKSDRDKVESTASER